MPGRGFFIRRRFVCETAQEWWGSVSASLEEMGWQSLYPPQDPQHRLAKGPVFVVAKEIVQHVAEAITEADRSATTVLLPEEY